MVRRICDRLFARRAFTLIELIVVMVIIAAMVTVIMPYATRSNEAMRIEHDCLSLAEVFRYAADLAADTGRPARVVINSGNNSYMLETADRTDGQNFVPVEYLGGTVHSFDPKIRIVDMAGFRIDGDSYQLVFEPSMPWPQASISISAADRIKTITIRGKRVEIEESSI